MFPLDLPRLFPRVHCDNGADKPPASDQKKLSTAISAVKGAISVQETELKRWKRIFDTHAKPGDDGEKYVITAHSHSLTLATQPPTVRRELMLPNPVKVPGYRIIRQGHRSQGGFDENRSTPVLHLIPCRGYLQAWVGVMGRFCGVRDVA